MNTKRLITASIFSLISASTALAADVMIPHQPASSTTSTIVAPTFSWTGLYLGVQAGGFSSKADVALVGQEKSLPLDKEFSPKLSGFVGGFYAGSNIDLGDNFIFGIDTDLMISGKKHTKTITIGAADNTTVENAVVRSRRSAEVVTTTGTPTGKTTQTAASEQPAPKVADVGTTSTKPAAETETSKQVTRSEVRGTPTPAEGSTQTVPSKKISPQTEGRSVQASSGLLARSDTRQPSVAVGGNGSNPVTSKPTAIGTGAGVAGESSSSSLVKSTAGNQTAGVGSSGTSAPAKSAEAGSAKTAEKAPVSSASSTVLGASQPAAKAPTSVQPASQPSAVEKTVPSGSLVLARSGSTSESAKYSNGTSGAQNGGHHSSSHGSGNANSHGAPHAGGRSSGAHPNGTNPHASRSHGGQNVAGHGAQSTQAVDKNNSSVYGIEQMKKMASELGLDQEDEVETLNHTFKQNWGGATRVRIGFAADRFMPYLAGGIAYGQFQDTVSISVKDEDGRVISSKNLSDETKTMIGYTLGGGVDFSLLDNVIVRAEYRYSDFGKKKFAKEKLEVNYKTNDFRVGVAYKF
ncbi:MULTISPECIES: outer membrane beta-barrel protein [unclassified Bartonella]|uniref:outer membrane beta-barrel protein n=1 Tax=unclassified Bartonella TaxID=2645622 RepID=UPI0035CFFF0D